MILTRANHGFMDACLAFLSQRSALISLCGSTTLQTAIVAITSYIALAFTQGMERAGEDTYFGYARFIDWSVTTPLLLLGLALLALPRASDSLPLVLSIMAVDLYMIATGLFAGLSGEGRGVWWVWFIVSSLTFVVLYAMIFGPLAKKAKEKVQAGGVLQRTEETLPRYPGTGHAG